ncbi:Phenylacetate 2-hydroxylase [Exophiala dermatitidis]
MGMFVAEHVPDARCIVEAPGGLPFIGHLHLLGGRKGENDATMYAQWAQEVKSDIISCRLGDQVTVVVNTFAAVRDLWVTRSACLLDRPPQPGFLDKLGVDITGSPMTEQIRRCRAASLKALGKSMWPEYYQLLEPSSEGLVWSLRQDGQSGAKLVDIFPRLRTMIFDLGLSLSYGVRYGLFDDAFMDSFLKSILDITAVRASTANPRHYMRLLRIFPEFTSQTIAAERIRARHIKEIYQAYKDRVAQEGQVRCVVTSLTEDGLSEDEIHGTCVSLLQAAPDTIATGLYQCIAFLSSPDGLSFQDKMYQSILHVYGGDRKRAWDQAFREEKVPLVTSLYKESLRFFTITPYSAPRQTSRDIHYQGRVIPKGVAVLMNAQHANHDTSHFGPDAWSFNPERFVDNDSPLPHLTFGAGGRICPAMALSNRILSALLIRLTLAFEMRQSTTLEGGRLPVLDAVRFSDVHDQLVAAPRHFNCRFIARDAAWLDELSLQSKAETGMKLS